MTRSLLYALVLLFLVSKSATSAPSCQQVVSELMPCVTYLEGKDPSPNCCSSIKALKALEKTHADRVAICGCSKQALAPVIYDSKLLPILPAKCGVDYNIPPIDKNYDCSKS